MARPASQSERTSSSGSGERSASPKYPRAGGSRLRGAVTKHQRIHELAVQRPKRLLYQRKWPNRYGTAIGRAPRPSKSIDFRWRTGAVTCYAAQKYTREGGGNQDNQFNEVQALLQNFLPRLNNHTALFVLVDGPYYTVARLNQLRGLVRLQDPRSYVASVNELVPILQEIAIEHPD